MADGKKDSDGAASAKDSFPLAVPQLRPPETATRTRVTEALSVEDERERATPWGREVSLFTLRKNRAFVTG